MSKKAVFCERSRESYKAEFCERSGGSRKVQFYGEILGVRKYSYGTRMMGVELCKLNDLISKTNEIYSYTCRINIRYKLITIT